MDNNNTTSSLWLIVVVLLVIGAGFYFLYAHYTDRGETEAVACTQEAKLCPDGSYVGRTGPECEFAACPTTQNEEDNWVSTSTPEVNFRYPTSLSTSYVAAVDWPPTAQVIDEEFSCTEAGEPTERAGKTSQETINGREYCITEVSEGAAGSIYKEYAYAFPRGEQTVVLTFSLRLPQCVNYSGPESTVCTQEQNSLNLNNLVDRIAVSLSIR